MSAGTDFLSGVRERCTRALYKSADQYLVVMSRIAERTAAVLDDRELIIARSAASHHKSDTASRAKDQAKDNGGADGMYCTDLKFWPL